ncbi:MAG: hypothetical protein K9L28_07785 [Synergistales bacterium]|nr:hypothetical protein [Synergistales bacterium]
MERWQPGTGAMRIEAEAWSAGNGVVSVELSCDTDGERFSVCASPAETMSLVTQLAHLLEEQAVNMEEQEATLVLHKIEKLRGTLDTLDRDLQRMIE